MLEAKTLDQNSIPKTQQWTWTTARYKYLPNWSHDSLTSNSMETFWRPLEAKMSQIMTRPQQWDGGSQTTSRWEGRSSWCSTSGPSWGQECGAVGGGQHSIAVELENQGNDHLKEVKEESHEKQDCFSIISIVQNKPSNSKNNSTASLSDPETISPSLRTNLPRRFVFTAVEEWFYSCHLFCCCWDFSCYVRLQRFWMACFGRAED